MADPVARHWAIRRDDVVWLTKYLDDCGAVISDNPKCHWSLLHNAIYFNSMNCVLVLLDRGSNINETTPWGLAPLHNAASRGRIDIMFLLLDRGANINSTDNFGWIPLHYAVVYGQVECVRLLLERGANGNITNAKGCKPTDFCEHIRNQETREQIWQLLNGGGQATKAAKPRPRCGRD